MPNWKIKDGGKYIADSSIANDANPGTDIAPVATLTGNINVKTVIGTGVYRQGVNITNNSTKIVADGNVVFDGAGTLTFEFNSTGAGFFGSVDGHKIIIRNYNELQLDSNYGGSPATLENVHVLDTSGFRNPEGFNYGIGKFLYSIIEGLNNYTGGTEDPVFLGEGVCRSNGFYESVCIGIDKMYPLNVENSYFDRNSTLYFLENSHSVFLGKINNCQNIFKIRVDGTNIFSYVLQDNLTGTPQDNGYVAGVNWLNSSNLQADGMTSTNADAWDLAMAKCMNRDPKFNNPAKGDYTLHPSSPHIGSGTENKNIGGTKVAIAFYVPESAAFTGNDLILESSFLTLNPNLKLTREDTNTIIGVDGNSLIGNIGVVVNSFKYDWTNYDGNFVKKAGVVYPLDDYTFDASFSPPSGENDNNLRVDDINPDGSAIETPARLTYLFTWTNSIDKPAIDAGNNYMVDNRAVANTWLKMELNTVPTVDKNGKGNGEPDFQATDDAGKYMDEVGFDPTTGPRIVEFTWCRMHDYQRRDYHVPA